MSPGSSLWNIAMLAGLLTSASFAVSEERSLIVGETKALSPEPPSKSLSLLISDLFETELSKRDLKIIDRSLLRTILSEKGLNREKTGNFVDGSQFLLSLEVQERRREMVLTGRVLEIASGRICSSFVQILVLQKLAQQVHKISSEIVLCDSEPQTEHHASTESDASEAVTEQERGMSLYLLGEPELAIAALRNALYLNSKLADARFWLMKSYFLAGRPREAEIEGKKFLAENGSDPRCGEVRELLPNLSSG